MAANRLCVYRYIRYIYNIYLYLSTSISVSIPIPISILYMYMCVFYTQVHKSVTHLSPGHAVVQPQPIDFSLWRMPRRLRALGGCRHLENSKCAGIKKKSLQLKKRSAKCAPD